MFYATVLVLSTVLAQIGGGYTLNGCERDGDVDKIPYCSYPRFGAPGTPRSYEISKYS